MAVKYYSSLFVFTFILWTASGQQQDCPQNWDRNAGRCYLFAVYPPKSYTEANRHCRSFGATLVSVNDAGEHAFIQGKLERLDPMRDKQTFTSGVGNLNAVANFRWQGDGTDVREQFWISHEDSRKFGAHIVYMWSAGKGNTDQYAWSRMPYNSTITYICEIDEKEAYRIYQGDRDFSFGLDIVSAEQAIPRGPKFIKIPEETIIVGDITSYLECEAEGFPKPSYKWYKVAGNGDRTHISPDNSNRYEFSDGKLTLQHPDKVKDNGVFQCEAFNEYGSILSDPVRISFGELQEFSNVAPGAVRADLYDGTFLTCPDITFSPSVFYQWVQEGDKYIRPELNDYYTFISSNGKLYFSETQTSDGGEYSCSVTLNSPNTRSFGLKQPPSKYSKGRPLIVEGQSATEFGPNIHNDFIYVKPDRPLRGNTIRLECFAYGKMPLTYLWKRMDGKWSPRHRFEDNDRVLIIDNAELEDRGNYQCMVTRTDAAHSDEKTYYLSIEATPKFIFPLRDQHADIGRQLTWQCEAEAVPLAEYKWYKDSVLLNDDPNNPSMRIRGNTLWIQSLEEKLHEGMYQCEASNDHGVTFSGAQLRVLSVPPSLKKNPLPSSLLGAVGGEVRIPCIAEGAPQPTIQWLKQGGNLNLSPQDEFVDDENNQQNTGAHYRLYTDGTLHIVNLAVSDEGRYTCKAINDLGEDESSGQLYVVSGITIFNPPANTEVIYNDTAMLNCEASYDSKQLDLVYRWKLNGYFIDTKTSFNYQVRERPSGLAIRAANFRHQGTYECVASTPSGYVSASAFLTVLAPPSECGGLYVDQKSITQTSMKLTWTDGADNGSPILKYKLEYHTDHNGTWKIALDDLDRAVTLQDNDINWPDRRTFQIENLNPFVGYTFRVSSKNQYGTSLPSLSSSEYRTRGDEPRVAPSNVNGGGGTVGVLTMRWDPLYKDEWGAKEISYIVQWRMMTPTNDGLWQNIYLKGTHKKYVATVGEENYYLIYEVRIGTKNEWGWGPNSSIAEIYSAEKMPPTACTQVNGQGFNSTAMECFWTPPPNTREAVGGVIKGFQVNWWHTDETRPGIWQIMKVHGTDNTAVLTGLDPNNNYWFDVQVLNTAGLGPRSEKYLIETVFDAPGTFPKYVTVWSHGSDTVLVTWQGITTNVWEDTLKGYRVKWFKAQDDIRNANEIETDKAYSEILTDIDEDTLYIVRIQGWNGGGDGSLSPSVYFTLGGSVAIDPHTTEIIAGVGPLSPSVLLLFIAMYVYLCVKN